MLLRRVFVRTVLCVVIVVAVLPSAAQESRVSEPRAITSLANAFGNGSFNDILMPDSGDAIDISTFDLDVGEPTATCDGTASHTAWFLVNHPGGTLDINTAFATGSNFDTVVQLYAANSGVVSSLTELACDDDSGGGPGSNDARLVMPNLASAPYYVRISCVSACGGTTDLALSVTYAPNETVPAHDSVLLAAPVTIGKPMTTLNAEHTGIDATENVTLNSCIMYNSVWYKLIVPLSGTYSFSTFGSVLAGPNWYPSDTKLAVYSSTGGTNYANFTELGCDDDFGPIGYGALPEVTLAVGTEVYVRVGSFRSDNLLNGSSYRLKVSVVALNNALINTGFETGSLAPWTMSHVDSIDGVTNAYFYSGGFSARMAGAPGKINKLKQKWNPANFGIKLPKDATVMAYFYYSTNDTVSNNVKATLKVTYTNGAPATVSSVKLPQQTATSSFIQRFLLTPITQTQVANISLTIKNKSSGGLVFIDSTLMRIYGNPGRAAKDAAGVLPPPAAPAAFRGTN